jgi:hypothetical protein
MQTATSIRLSRKSFILIFRYNDECAGEIPLVGPGGMTPAIVSLNSLN